MKRWTMALAALLAVACTGGTDVVSPPAPVLATVSVTLSAASVTVGQYVTAVATGTDQNGAPIATGPVVWTAGAAASVTDDGRVTGVAPGQAVVMATAGGKSGQAVLTVTALPAVALVLKALPSTTVANRAPFPQQPVVQLVNANGAAVAQAGVVVTASAAGGSLSGALTAATDATGVATFSGLALSGSAGIQTLTFAAPGLTPVTASLSITPGEPAAVVLAGGTGQTAPSGSGVAAAPSIRVTDADGNPVAGVAVAFDVTAGAGTVTGSPATTNASGVATLGSWALGAVGTNTLMAHVVGSTTGVTITATAMPAAPALTGLRVSVNPPSIQVGQSAQAVAFGTDQYGADIATGPVVWSSSSGVSISQAGTITAVAAGQATVTATAGGKSAQATIAITSPPVPVLTSLSVTVTPAAIQTGGTAQAVAFGKDQFGADIATGPVVWSSTGQGTVSQAGVVTPTSVGQALITATAGGVSAQALVTISGAPPPPAPVLTSLTVVLTPPSVTTGGTSRAVAYAKDQFGQDIATGPVTWSSTVGATITPSGDVVGLSVGQAVITATVGGATARATLTITPLAPVLTSFEVTLTPTTIAVDGTAEARIIGRDQFGQPIAGYSLATASSNPGVATIAGTRVTGVSPGTATISITVGAVSGSAVITVTGPPPGTPVLKTLEVTLAPNPINVGETTQATVVGRDQYGAPIETGPITFSTIPRIAGTSALIFLSGGRVEANTQVADSAPIIATAGKVTGQAILRVKFLATLTLSVTPSTILVGDTAEFSYVALDQFGHPYDFTLTPYVTCAPSAGCSPFDGEIQVIPGTRKLVGIKEGYGYLHVGGPIIPGATYGLSSTVRVTVRVPKHLVYFTIAGPATLRVGETGHVTVAGQDQDHQPFPLGSVAYYANPPRIATITQSGDFVGLNPGVAVISVEVAFDNGLKGIKQFNVSVTGPPTARLSASSSPVSAVPDNTVIPQPSVQVLDDASGQQLVLPIDTITATLTGGGGTLSGTTRVVTGQFGVARFDSLKIRGKVGVKTITFSSAYEKPTTWQFTLGPGAAAAFGVNAGNSQTAAAGSLVPIDPSVQVVDVDGNPVPGVAVNFTVTGGGGTVSPAVPLLTDANGLAHVSWRLGAAGANTLKVTAGGVAAFVIFTATATP